MGDYKETLFSWYNKVNELTAVAMAYTNPSQTESQNGEGSWAYNPTPSCGAIDNCSLLGGERQFSLSVARCNEVYCTAQIGLEIKK